MALHLSSVRKITKLNNAVKSGTWDFKVAVPVFRLRGRTLGLVGFGNIPQAVSKKAQAFGLNVIAYDPFVPKSVALDHNVELVSLDELYMQSDYIPVHLPLIQHNEKIISHNQFNKMRKESFIINTARGPVIDEEALIKTLQEEKITGVVSMY
jgi:D-3-phosphoglycerate dehydrogenase